jgi:hypothetical protein
MSGSSRIADMVDDKYTARERPDTSNLSLAFVYPLTLSIALN